MEEKELHNLLYSSIQHRNASLLDDLLNGETGQKFIDLPGEDGNMLLHAAVLENDLKSVECLIKHGANPNVFDTHRSRTPLHLAVELNLTDIVKAFLELEYINLELRDDRNLTCHEIAQFCDNLQLADSIQETLNNIDESRNEFYKQINQACASDKSNQVEKLLLDHQKKILERLNSILLPSESRKVFAQTSLRQLINWTSSSWNDVTLLFKAASKGQTKICEILIRFGATAKCNENTNYSPLYVAAYGGHTETVKLLLDNFPSLISQVTIEKWTVLHACCLQGHSETAKLVLTYAFPEDLKRKFVSRSGLYEYQFALDLNAQDAAGQTVIYLAVSADNEKLLDTLLHFNIQAQLINQQKQVIDQQKSSKDVNVIIKTPNAETGDKLTDLNSKSIAYLDRNKIDNIVDQLSNLGLKKVDAETNVKSSDKYLICPFELDTYCDYNSKTALHLAIYRQYHSIATTLLVNGSDPNLPILSRDPTKNEFGQSNSATGLNWLRSSKSSCLKEACRLNDEYMCDILIRYGAIDQGNAGLQIAARNKNSRLVSTFLSLKSFVDPEYKINKKCNVEFASRYKQGEKISKSRHDNITTTFSSMFPSTPVMIHWQNLKCIEIIDTKWLIDASLIHNKRLKHPTNSLLSITRLDISTNNLKYVHPVIFRLPSLRDLNLSKNNLESLLDLNQRRSIQRDHPVPTSKLIESQRYAMQRSKSSNLANNDLESSNIIDLNEAQEWNLPHLETLDLSDNRLMSLPDCLFELPKLRALDISSNQIRQLPWCVWTAPSLVEVFASSNLLDDLPKIPKRQKSSLSPIPRSEHCSSPQDEKSSLHSNQSVQDKSESFLSSIGSGSQIDPSSLTIMNIPDVSTCNFEATEKPIKHLSYWKQKICCINSISSLPKSLDETNELQNSNSICKITHLNLSHNSFESIPPVLSCAASELTRLNLSHNRITSLGSTSLYPVKLKSLDLSNNRISDWFADGSKDPTLRVCYMEQLNRDSSTSKFIHSQNGLTCIHKSHSTLECLKSINLNSSTLR